MRKIYLFIFISISTFLLSAQELLYLDSSMLKSYDSIDTPIGTQTGSCQLIDSIIHFALSKNGSYYKYGAIGPNFFDCSGFMYYVFKNYGITLPHSSSSQYKMGKAVKKENIRRGDLLFFIRGKGVGHVALVIEADSVNKKYHFIHASTYKTGVRIDDLDRAGYAHTYVGARRILECKENRAYLIPNQHLATIEKDSLSVILSLSDTLQSIPDTPQSIPKTLPSPQPHSIYYTVKQGDTLYAISRKYNVSVSNIKRWNNLSSDMIRIGQKLKIYR